MLEHNPSLALAHHKAGVSYHGMYTAYVSTGPRRLDNGTCTRSLVGVIRQARALLPGARIVVIFDGRSTRASDDMWQQYGRKKATIRALADSVAPLEVIEHSQYLHQSVGLRAAMNATGSTPYVFVAQDDVLLYPRINVSGITWRLANDRRVRYVKLFNFDNVNPSLQAWSRPARPHPTDQTLFSTLRFSDRPHFCHRAIYDREIWPHVRESDRDVPETLLRRHPDGRAASWREEVGPRISGLWFYAPHKATRHESHNACGRVSTFKKGS